jgi:hypothetical protein
MVTRCPKCNREVDRTLSICFPCLLKFAETLLGQKFYSKPVFIPVFCLFINFIIYALFIVGCILSHGENLGLVFYGVVGFVVVILSSIIGLFKLTFSNSPQGRKETIVKIILAFLLLLSVAIPIIIQIRFDPSKL